MNLADTDKRMESTIALDQQILNNTHSLNTHLKSLFSPEVNADIDKLTKRIVELLPFCYVDEDNDPMFVYDYQERTRLNRFNHLSQQGRRPAEEEDTHDKGVDRLDNEAYGFKELIIRLGKADGSDKDTEFLPILNWIKRYEEVKDPTDYYLSDLILAVRTFMLPNPAYHYMMVEKIPKAVLPRNFTDAAGVQVSFNKMRKNLNIHKRLLLDQVQQMVGTYLSICQSNALPDTASFLKEFVCSSWSPK